MKNMLGLMYEMMENDNMNKKAFTPEVEPRVTVNTITEIPYSPTLWNYKEDQIVDDFYDYLKSTYGQHYATDEKELQCFDAWIAMGDATPTFRNTAIKYLWRYGKKGGNNKKDLLKAMHYVLLCLYNDHYKDVK